MKSGTAITAPFIKSDLLEGSIMTKVLVVLILTWFLGFSAGYFHLKMTDTYVTGEYVLERVKACGEDCSIAEAMLRVPE